MNSRGLEERAIELRDAASALRDAVRAGDVEGTEIAMEARTVIFDALATAAQAMDGPLAMEVERLVREVLEIDREVEAALQEQLGQVRGELDQISHARRVAGRQHIQDSVPRFVSRRA